VFQANEYGVLQEWPKGFADKDFTITRDYLLAAVAKRKKKEGR
jgi:hypothetical protein